MSVHSTAEILTKLRNNCNHNLGKVTANLVDAGRGEISKTRVAHFAGQHSALSQVIKNIDGMLIALSANRLDAFVSEMP